MVVRNVLVLGGGSAGLIAALSLKTHLPQLAITVLRARELGVIGVGESTTTYLPQHLHGYLGIPQGEFFAAVRPSWKLAIRFFWGPRPVFYYPFTFLLDRREPGLSRPVGYYCDDTLIADQASTLVALGKAFPRLANGAPLIGRNTGYHLENERLVAYLERQALQRGIEVRDATVAGVETGPAGIAALHLKDGTQARADLFLDCSGFRSELLGKALGVPFESYGRSLYNNRAVIGGWLRQGEPTLPYTTAETLSAGWCWQIDHDDRIHRGYVYSAEFQSDADAEAEFRRLCPRAEETRVVKFVSGRYAESWVQNVVAIGNAAGFVEPLEATALYVICAVANALTETLRESGCQPEERMRREYNKYSNRLWDNIRNFLAIHYRFNSRLDTPYWKACRAEVDLAGAAPIVDFYREYGPQTLWAPTLIDPLDPFRLDGYYILLLGQQVPYRRRYEPPFAEQVRFQELRNNWLSVAENGLTCDEAFAVVHSPHWQWRPDFYA